MKYQILLDAKPEHCLDCPLLDRETDGCVLRRNGDSQIEYENWGQQMEHCPIHEVLSPEVKL